MFLPSRFCNYVKIMDANWILYLVSEMGSKIYKDTITPKGQFRHGDILDPYLREFYET